MSASSGAWDRRDSRSDGDSDGDGNSVSSDGSEGDDRSDSDNDSDSDGDGDSDSDSDCDEEQGKGGAAAAKVTKSAKARRGTGRTSKLSPELNALYHNIPHKTARSRNYIYECSECGAQMQYKSKWDHAKRHAHLPAWRKAIERCPIAQVLGHEQQHKQPPRRTSRAGQALTAKRVHMMERPCAGGAGADEGQAAQAAKKPSLAADDDEDDDDQDDHQHHEVRKAQVSSSTSSSSDKAYDSEDSDPDGERFVAFARKLLEGKKITVFTTASGSPRLQSVLGLIQMIAMSRRWPCRRDVLCAGE